MYNCLIVSSFSAFSNLEVKCSNYSNYSFIRKKKIGTKLETLNLVS